jgi:hypothetical protein
MLKFEYIVLGFCPFMIRSYCSFVRRTPYFVNSAIIVLLTDTNLKSRLGAGREKYSTYERFEEVFGLYYARHKI